MILFSVLSLHPLPPISPVDRGYAICIMNLFRKQNLSGRRDVNYENTAKVLFKTTV